MACIRFQHIALLGWSVITLTLSVANLFTESHFIPRVKLVLQYRHSRAAINTITIETYEIEHKRETDRNDYNDLIWLHPEQLPKEYLSILL